MSERGNNDDSDEDALIRQWREKRNLPAKSELDPVEDGQADTGNAADGTSVAASPTGAGSAAPRDDLQDLAEDLLSGPRPGLGRISEIGLDSIPERPAPRPTPTAAALSGADTALRSDLHHKPRTIRETADAVAAAVAGAQATTQTHIPESNEIEDARRLMRARMDKRRRRSAMLFIVTVLAPLAVMFAYLSLLVEPLYETRAVIAISQPGQDGQGGGAGVLGALGGGPGIAQAFRADEYIRSAAMQRDLAGPEWAAQLAEAGISTSYLLAPDGVAKMVDSSVDVQAGVVTIFTRMPNPEQAVALSSAVLKQVSRHVDNLGAQLGTQRLAVTRNSADEARADLKEARRALVELQILAGDIDPAQRIAATYAQIADIETQIYDLRAQIDRSVVSGNADSYEIDRKRELIQKLQEQAEQSRQSLVDRDDGRTSPNELLMEFELAAQNVIIAEETLSSALSAWSRAQVEVALERSVTQVVVPALAPTEPTYPRILVTLFITAVIGAAVFFTLRMILLDPE